MPQQEGGWNPLKQPKDYAKEYLEDQKRLTSLLTIMDYITGRAIKKRRFNPGSITESKEKSENK